MLSFEQYDPGGQGTGCDPPRGQNDAMGHGKHVEFDLEPLALLYEPAGQGTAAFMPVEGQNDPVGHSEGVEAPSGQKVPAGQSKQALLDLAPISLLCDPAGQCIKVSIPIEGQNAPAGHGLGSDLPAGQKYPSGHSRQELLEVAPVSVP